MGPSQRWGSGWNFSWLSEEAMDVRSWCGRPQQWWGLTEEQGEPLNLCWSWLCGEKGLLAGPWWPYMRKM